MANELKHYGVLGMKWGIRRYQKKNGQLTSAGKKRYDDVSQKKEAYKAAKKEYSKSFDKAYNKSIAAYSPIKKHRQANDERWRDAQDKAFKLEAAKADYKKAKQKADIETANYLYSKQNKKANEAIATMSMGKALTETFLMGSYGALKYNEAKARGASTGRAAVEGVLHNTANNFLYTAPSLIKYFDNREARK